MADIPSDSIFNPDVGRAGASDSLAGVDQIPPAAPPAAAPSGITTSAGTPLLNRIQDRPSSVNVPFEYAPFRLRPVVAQEDTVQLFRTLFDNGGQAFARDLVRTHQGDLDTQINPETGEPFGSDILSYEGLRDGSSPFLELLPRYRGLSPSQRQLSDDEIAGLLSTVEAGTFPRPFVHEALRSAPSAAFFSKGTKAAWNVLAPLAMKVPTLPGKVAATVAAAPASVLGGLVSAALPYMGMDWLIEESQGPNPVVTPGHRAFEASAQTMGGGFGAIYMPWLWKTKAASASSGIVQNVARRMRQRLEDVPAGLARTARANPAPYVAGEAVAIGGEGLGAYVAERYNPGGAGTRLALELVGGNTFAATLARAVPPLMTKLLSAPEDLSGGLINTQQRKLFERVNELYEDYGQPGQREALVENLKSAETSRLLQEAFPGVDFSAAQRSGDPLMMAMEAQRASGGGPLDVARVQASAAAQRFMFDLIKGFSESGDPRLVGEAASLRQDVVENAIQDGLDDRIRAIVSAQRTLSGQPGQEAFLSQAELSNKINDVIKTSMESSSDTMNRLWGGLESFDLIEPLNPDNPGDFVQPHFLDVWESTTANFENRALLTAFLDEVPELRNFIADSRHDLGMTPTPSFTRTELETVANYEGEVTAALSGVESGRVIPGDAPEGIRRKSAQESMAAGEQIDLTGPEGTNPRAVFYRNQGDQAGTGNPDLQSFYKKLEELAQARGTAMNRAGMRSGGAAPTTETSPITTKQISEMRSKALALTRKFAAEADGDDTARRVGVFAEALADELDVDGFGLPYNEARDYTRAHHDVFTRTVLGDITASARTGADRVPPEITFQRIVSAGNAGITLNRARALAEMARFVGRNPFSGPMQEGQTYTTVNNLMDSYLRGLNTFASRESIDPETGLRTSSIDPVKLNRWKSDNSELLKMFPQLNDDLSDAVKAQDTLNVFKATRARFLDEQKNMEGLAGLLGGVAPRVVIEEAFNSRTPERALENLFMLRAIDAPTNAPGTRRISRGQQTKERQDLLDAQNAEFSDEVYAGLPGAAAAQQPPLTEGDLNNAFASTIMEFASQVSGGEGSFNAQVFYTTLLEPLPNGAGESLMDVAQNLGVFTRAQGDKMRFMSRQMLQLHAADAAGKLADPTFAAEAGPLLDFYIGVVGAAAGSQAYSAIAGGGGPGSLRAASAGSVQLSRLLKELPAAKKMAALDLVFTDPEMVAALMDTPPTERGRARQYQKVITLVSEKLFGAATAMEPNVVRELYEDDTGRPGRPEDQAEVNRLLQEREDQQRRQFMGPPPPPPTTPVMPVNVRPPANLPPGVPMRPAPQPAQQASATPGPANMETYRALFPNDDLGSGIGSLMG